MFLETEGKGADVLGKSGRQFFRGKSGRNGRPVLVIGKAAKETKQTQIFTLTYDIGQTCCKVVGRLEHLYAGLGVYVQAVGVVGPVDGAEEEDNLVEILVKEDTEGQGKVEFLLRWSDSCVRVKVLL